MTEESQSTSSPTGAGDSAAETSNTASTTPKASGQELLDEVNRLGMNLVEVIEVAWNSDERRRIQADLRTGLAALAAGLEEGITRIAQSQQGRELIDRAESVAENLGTKVRTSKATSDLTDALAKGLRSFSEQVEKLSEDLQKKPPTTSQSPSDSAATADPQDIPISRE